MDLNEFADMQYFTAGFVAIIMMLTGACYLFPLHVLAVAYLCHKFRDKVFKNFVVVVVVVIVLGQVFKFQMSER